jgi:hypothetical protein
MFSINNGVSKRRENVINEASHQPEISISATAKAAAISVASMPAVSGINKLAKNENNMQNGA